MRNINCILNSLLFRCSQREQWPNNELSVVSKVVIKFQQLKKEILRDQATNVRKRAVICLKTNIQLFESNRVVTKQYRLKHGVESKIKYVL